MTTHLPNNQAPSERMALYRHRADTAAKSGIDTSDLDMRDQFFALASEWQRLAEEARAELCSASARPFWV
jgi:hypothetical protein